jgi:hypothetical protein
MMDYIWDNIGWIGDDEEFFNKLIKGKRFI